MDRDLSLKLADDRTPKETREYRCMTDINLYDSPACQRLATQAARGRQLRIGHPPAWNQVDPPMAIEVCLCEDDYPGWLAPGDFLQLEPVTVPYQAVAWTEAEIQSHLPAVIAFTQAAMAQPNIYLWGGTVGPNYDCSGLMQAAFASVGIRLPRDAYQQEAFTTPIDLADLRSGDLVFFGTPEKATHVGLYLGDQTYIHSSGQEQGRNGIGLDRLSPDGDAVSQAYYRQLRGAGRVTRSYHP
ncbi:glycoside hydrolase [Leptolyngbya sp. 'hensonii']|uniref:C40 family peptidase n=1 Tax=Leptolyngbya sp. 'hensonii' TaxID=1922337 RepID=UPI00094FF435|nr:C40 family peptidase [Leptolyngbya sp. 'hensonii']OLP16945.1 glycoside hydrolase [Leptolyngbya sp. 'hensonii']